MVFVDLKVKNKNSGTYLIVVFGILLLIVLIIFTGVGNYKKTKAGFVELGKIKNDNILLESKIEKLREIDSAGFIKDNDQIESRFPSEDPSLYMLSQLKLLAVKHSLLLSGLTINSGAPNEDILTVLFHFNLLGSKSNIDNFVREIYTIAPLSKISEIDILDYPNSINDINISMTIVTYYSLLPKVVPDFDDGYKELTELDISRLEKLKQLTVLSSFKVTPQAGNSNAINPFTLGVPNISEENQIPE